MYAVAVFAPLLGAVIAGFLGRQIGDKASQAVVAVLSGLVGRSDLVPDDLTVALGPRMHFKIGEKTWIRPALAFAFGLDDPLQRWEERSVQLDIPFIF